MNGYSPDEDWDVGQDDGFADIMQWSGINWAALAESFYKHGPGSRGPYGQIPRSADFFSICLQAPVRVMRTLYILPSVYELRYGRLACRTTIYGKVTKPAG